MSLHLFWHGPHHKQWCEVQERTEHERGYVRQKIVFFHGVPPVIERWVFYVFVYEGDLPSAEQVRREIIRSARWEHGQKSEIPEEALWPTEGEKVE